MDGKFFLSFQSFLFQSYQGIDLALNDRTQGALQLLSQSEGKEVQVGW